VLADMLGAMIGALLIAYGVTVGVLPFLSESNNLAIVRAGYALIVGGILAANILVGLGEQFVLSRHLKLNLKWFRACVIGVVSGFFFWLILVIIILTRYKYNLGSSLDPWILIDLAILNYLLLVLIPAFLQWRILKKIVHHASRWFWIRALSSIVLSFIDLGVFWFPAIIISIFLGLILHDMFAFDQIALACLFILIVLAQILTGAIQGAISGAFMQKLLKEPAADPPG
jgi:hypothetical protein